MCYWNEGKNPQTFAINFRYESDAFGCRLPCRPGCHPYRGFVAFQFFSQKQGIMAAGRERHWFIRTGHDSQPGFPQRSSADVIEQQINND